MLDIKNTWIVCPTNDLEAVTIIAIAKEYGFYVSKGPSIWGIHFEDVLDISSIPAHITNLVICELPFKYQATILKLKQRRIRVIELDHHVYASNDKSNKLSCIEQFAHLIDHPLTNEQTLIAANDKGFIPKLASMGASYQQMLTIRQQEADIRGVTALREKAKQWLKNTAPNTLNQYLIYTCPAEFSLVMAELVQLPSEKKYLESMEQGKALCLNQVALLYTNKNGLTQIEVLGHQHRTFFKKFTADFNNNNATAWFGGEAPNFFFGIKAQLSETLPNTLIEQIKVQLGQ